MEEHWQPEALDMKIDGAVTTSFIAYLPSKLDCPPDCSLSNKHFRYAEM